MLFKASVVISFLTSLILVMGCGESTEEMQSRSAAELKTALEQLPYEIKFVTPPEKPGYPDGPGVVYGRVRSGDGEEGRFWFSMGPSPEQLPGRGLGSKSPTGPYGDFYVKVAPVRKISGRSLEQFRRVVASFEDAGCKVAIKDHCPI